MPKKIKRLGEFELIVLAALIHLGDQAYGDTIRQEIEGRTGRSTTVGAIYTTLSRMEDKGIVSSKLEDKASALGGRPRRIFKLTALGNKAFRHSVTSLGSMLKGIAPWARVVS